MVVLWVVVVLAYLGKHSAFACAIVANHVTNKRGRIIINRFIYVLSQFVQYSNQSKLLDSASATAERILSKFFKRPQILLFIKGRRGWLGWQNAMIGAAYEAFLWARHSLVERQNFFDQGGLSASPA